MGERGFTLKKIKERFGLRLKHRRRELGYMRQLDLARALGTDQARVSRWESGHESPLGTYRKALKQLLKVNETFFEQLEPAHVMGFEAAANFLERYSKLSEMRKALVTMVVYDDLQKLAEWPAFASCAKALENC